MSVPDIDSSFRSEMPVAARWAYFDHAAVAPISGPAQRRLTEYAETAARQGAAAWTEWSREIEQSRAVAAQMLAASAEEIAWVPNTTTGISLIAEGLPWQEGDNVVTLANEFPSNLYPWMNLESRGVQLRRVRPPSLPRWRAEDLLEACDGRTRLIAVSWVGYASGFRADVPRLVELAHQRGVLVMLDAIQGLGVFPLNVSETGLDFLAADGHKWLLGPEGAGLLYVRREHLAQLRPLHVGWNSVRHRHDYSKVAWDLRDEAARYEGGSQNMPGVLALGASLRMLQRHGVGPDQSAVATRVLGVVARLCDRLRAIGATIHSHWEGPHASGIVSLELPGRDPATLRKQCLQAGVVLSCRNGRLRASPHAYTNDEDIARLCDALVG